MPDKKITDLVDGGAPQDPDEFVIARAGDNFKVDWAEMSSAAAANQIAVTADGNTAGALALVSSGTLTIAGGNNITVSQAGNAITISGQNIPAESQTFIAALSVSDTVYTSGTVRITGVGGGVTVSSNTGQRIDISVAAPVAQSVQTQNVVDVTLSGNTAGALALISSGTLTLAGGNGVTLSQAGNAVTISGITQSVQPETQTFIAGISASNTLYTSGNVRITGVGGGVTISSNTGQRIDISVAAQSVQPETQTFIAGISASDTLYTSGSVRITGVGGGITVSSNTGQRIDLSVAAPVAQTNQSGNVYASSNTFGTSSGTYDARSISIAGRGAVSVAASNSGWIISAPVQSTQVETQTFIAGVSASDTLYTSGNVRISGSQAVTVRSGTGQLVIIDAPAQTVQTQNLHNVTLSGNTAGAMAQISSGTLTLAGGNNITLSQAGNAVTISAGAGVETQTAISGIVGSNATYTSGTVSIMGVGGGITVGSNTGQRIDLSVQPAAHQTAGAISNWPPTGATTSSSPMTSALFVTGAATTTLSPQIWPMPFEAPLSINRVLMPIILSISSSASNTDWSWTFGQSFGLYSMNAGTLSLVSSYSNQQRISYDSAANSTNASLSWQMSYGAGTDVSSSSSMSTNNAGVTGLWSSISSQKAHPFALGAHSHSAGQYVGVWGFSSSSVGANVASITGYGINVAGNPMMQEQGLNVSSTYANSFLQGRVALTQSASELQASFASTDVTTASNNASFVNRALAVSLFSR